MDRHGLVVQRRLQRLGGAGDVVLRGRADGVVVDRIEPEGADQVLGEGGVGCVGLDQLEGDGLADRRGA